MCDLTERQEKLATFLKEAVEGLKNDVGSCCRFILDDELAVFVGWSDGYDPTSRFAIHDANDPTWAINAGIKVRCDALWTDYDWLDFPTDEDGEPIDTGITVSPKEDYMALAAWLLGQYDSLTEE